MASKPTSPQMRAWRSFLTAHARIIARMEQELEDHEQLPLTWYEVLLLLRESSDGRLRMHELAESRLLSRSAATRLIDRIEGAGLVRREASTTDRRGTFVVMTDAGLATLRKAAPVHVGGIEAHFARYVDDDEAETVAAVMNRVVEQLNTDPIV